MKTKILPLFWMDIRFLKYGSYLAKYKLVFLWSFSFLILRVELIHCALISYNIMPIIELSKERQRG